MTCHAQRRLVGFWLVTLAFPLFALGCSGSSTLPPGEDNLRTIARFYGMYTGMNRGQPPPDEKRFKAFIQKQNPDMKLEELFVSPRDNQPIVVLYNRKVGAPKPGEPATIVAHEKVGVDGQIMVARSTTEVEALEADKLKTQLKNP